MANQLTIVAATAKGTMTAAATTSALITGEGKFDVDLRAGVP
jgi:hypothetical protein